jgi:hypothetical protein
MSLTEYKPESKEFVLQDSVVPQTQRKLWTTFSLCKVGRRGGMKSRDVPSSIFLLISSSVHLSIPHCPSRVVRLQSLLSFLLKTFQTSSTEITRLSINCSSGSDYLLKRGNHLAFGNMTT